MKGFNSLFITALIELFCKIQTHINSQIRNESVFILTEFFPHWNWEKKIKKKFVSLQDWDSWCLIINKKMQFIWMAECVFGVCRSIESLQSFSRLYSYSEIGFSCDLTITQNLITDFRKSFSKIHHQYRSIRQQTHLSSQMWIYSRFYWVLWNNRDDKVLANNVW